jgi:hypothetical protein
VAGDALPRRDAPPYNNFVRCLSCKYDLRNLTSGAKHRCPECGRAFDPKDPTTFDTGRYRAPPTIVIVAMGLCLCVVFVMTCKIGLEIDKPEVFIASAVGLVASVAIVAIFSLFHIAHFAAWKLRRPRS